MVGASVSGASELIPLRAGVLLLSVEMPTLSNITSPQHPRAARPLDLSGQSSVATSLAARSPERTAPSM